jgi:hypothetical protein
MNTKSDTPETDAIANTAWDGASDDYSAYAKMRIHARRLERERDEALQAVKKLLDIIGPPEDETWATDDELKEAYDAGMNAIANVEEKS